MFLFRMKWVRNSMLGLALFGTTMSMSSCWGSFALTGMVYDFNKDVGNGIIRQVVFWAFIILPVYGLATFIDAVILNLLEFWTGSNPIAMGPNDMEEQFVKKNGKNFKITATQNKFNIVHLDGKDAGKSVDIFYIPEDRSWNYATEGQEAKLASLTGTNSCPTIAFYGQDQVIEMDLDIIRNNDPKSYAVELAAK